MGKFIIIQDMRSLPCYKNVNARLLYIHVAMGCDISTYSYVTSLRRLAGELDMTVDTIRHAIKVLERDGLIDVEKTPQGAPQGAPHGAPHSTPHSTPHLTILKIKKNGTPNGTLNTTPNTTPSTTPSTTENPNDINNKIYITEKDLTHDARVSAWAKLLEGEFSLDTEAAEAAVKAFFRRQRLKGKTWESEGDALAHLLAWCEKRLPRQHAAKAGKLSDHDARMAEYQRTEAEKKQQDEEERLKDEVEKLTRWRREALQRKDKQQADVLAAAITDMKARLQTAERRGA